MLSFKKIIDISWPISQSMTAYKDRHVVQFTQTKTFEQDHARESVVTLGSHSGTHVDAPAHFLENGASIEEMPLSSLIGPCSVIDLTHCAEKITINDVAEQIIPDDHIILLKTKNSLLEPEALFNPSFVYLAADAARYLSEKRIKGVGIDYLGIERAQPDHATHDALLAKNMPIIEGLRLKDVNAGSYFFCCLPLAIQSLEAAPARAVLLL